MDIEKIASSLNPAERKVLKVLDSSSYMHDIMKATGLKDVEVMRALQWLQNKNAVKLIEEQKDIVSLDENGIKYLKYGLPEKIFLQSLDKPKTLKEIGEDAKLSSEELSISLGALKSKAAIEIIKDKELLISITEHGKSLLKKGFIEDDVKINFRCVLGGRKQHYRRFLDEVRQTKKER